ncbi:PRD domain-containing protein [Erysipelothrix urinaevulpis]|uniref:PRD domain-containing protein n=1 Tax=Erysipelothrix urinaevulpis TaxID=2683717 RepID=UPI0022A7FF01|nr:PRD domain-containing protein [Erysipelothrix urinaevulpis]
MNNKYTIIRVLNHNSVMCSHNTSQQKRILFHKGIGFRRNIGEEITLPETIEKNLLVLEGDEAETYHSILKRAKDEKLIQAVQEIVEKANEVFDQAINPNLNITLLDHLIFAIERLEQGINITYPFMNELKIYYKEEFEFAGWVLKYLNENTDLSFPKDELSFIVLHVHASLTKKGVSEVLEFNQINYEVRMIIEREIGQKIEISSRYYMRFVNHLEFAIRRSVQQIPVQNNLNASIASLAPQEYLIATMVADHISKIYHIKLEESEVGYLALHIHSMIQNNYKVEVIDY